MNTKHTITETEKLQLIGLLALAAKHSALLTEIQTAAEDLLGVPPEDRGTTHVSDAIYEGTIYLTS